MTEDQLLATFATMGRTDELNPSVFAAVAGVSIVKPDAEDEEEANGVTEKVEDAISEKDDLNMFCLDGKRASLPHEKHFAKQDLLSQSFSGLPRSGSQHLELSALDGPHIRDRLVVVQSRSMDSIGLENSPRSRLQGILKRADSEHSGLSGERSHLSHHSRSPPANPDHLSIKQVDFSHSKLKAEELRGEVLDLQLEDRGAADGASPRLGVEEEAKEDEEDPPTTPVVPTDKITQELEMVAETLVRTRDSPPAAIPSDILRLNLDFEESADQQSSSESAAGQQRLCETNEFVNQVHATKPSDGHPLRNTIDIAALPDTRSASPDSSRTPRPPTSPAPRKAVVATAAR